MKLKNRLKRYPQIMTDTKKMMALLVEKLPESELYKIDMYYQCVECGVVSEMLEMDYYNQMDIGYFVDKLPFDRESILGEGRRKEIIKNWFKMLGIEGYDYESGIRFRVLNARIQDLDFEDSFKDFAKSKGYKTFKDILPLTVKDLIIYQREERFNANEVVSKISDIIREDNEKYGEIYTPDSHPGKNLCNTMREIRRKIAEANDIPFESFDCHNSGPCRGTCPACDAEIEYLNEQIEKKKKRGERIKLAGIAKNDIKNAGCDIDPIEKTTRFGGIRSFDMFPSDNRAAKGDG